MEGYIKLHRKIKLWEWYEDANTFRLFIHCLIESNHKDKNWKGIDIKRGQFHTSINHLSHDLKLSDKAIRISLEKLKKTKNIVIKGASNGTMITICNYDSYQSNSETEGQAKGRTKGQTMGERGATTKNEKNEKNEKEQYTCFSFDDFWTMYAKSSDKSKCKSKYDKIEEADRDLIKNRLPIYLGTITDKKYQKNPLTYLNGKCWNDIDDTPVEVERPKYKVCKGYIQLL